MIYTIESLNNKRQQMTITLIQQPANAQQQVKQLQQQQ